MQHDNKDAMSSDDERPLIYNSQGTYSEKDVSDLQSGGVGSDFECDYQSEPEFRDNPENEHPNSPKKKVVHSPIKSSDDVQCKRCLGLVQGHCAHHPQCPKSKQQTMKKRPVNFKHNKINKKQKKKQDDGEEDMWDEHGEALEDNTENGEVESVMIGMRPLIPIPQIHIGINVLGKGIPIFQHVRSVIDEKTLCEGTWQQSDIAKNMNDTSLQHRIASSFSRPCLDETNIREISSDRIGICDAITIKDKTADVLNCFIATHMPTELNLPKSSSEASRVWTPGGVKNRQSDLYLHSPDEVDGISGGLEGVHTVTLWQICPPTMSMAPDIQNLVSQIGQVAHPGDIIGDLVYSVSNKFVDFRMNQGRVNRHHVTARFRREDNVMHLGTDDQLKKSDILCSDVLYNIAHERSVREDFEWIELDNGDKIPNIEDGYDNEIIIPRNECMKENYKEEKDVDKIDDSLFSTFLWTNILDGIDAKGNICKLRVDCIVLKMKYPGSDGNLLLDKMRIAMPTCVDSLSNIISHMAIALNKAINLNLDSLFSTGDITELTEPGQMLPAIFNTCRKKHIFNVQWQGIRYNVEDDIEMQLYATYMQDVLKSRKNYYNIVREGVAAEANNLVRYSSTSKKRITPEHYEKFGDTIQLFEGFHYVHHNRHEIDNMIDSMRQENKDNDSWIISAWNQMLLSNVVTIVGENYHWRERGMVPFIGGLFVHINHDLVSRFDKKAVDNGKKPFSLISQAHDMASNAFIWIRNHLELSEDPFHIFHQVGGPVADFKWLLDNQNGLPIIRDLVSRIKDYVSNSTFQRDNRHNLQLRDLHRFYGSTSHGLTVSVKQLCDNVDICEIARAVQTTILFNVRDALSNMEAGEFIQVKWAARAMFSDLKNHAAHNAKEWIDDYSPFKRYLQDTGNFLYNDSSIFAHWNSFNINTLNYELTYMNQCLMEGIINARIAQFVQQDKQWLGSIMITDGAHFSVWYKNARSVLTELACTWKSPGAGIDSLWNLICQTLLSYGRHVAIDEEIRKFFSMDIAADKTCSHLSNMSIPLMLGSGLPKLGNGDIDVSNCNYKIDAYRAFVVTELNKQDPENTKTIAQLENSMNESGSGDGAQKENWTSTNQMKAYSVAKMWGLPNLVATGNQELSIPRSSTARWQRWSSNCFDGTTGVISTNSVIGVNSSMPMQSKKGSSKLANKSFAMKIFKTDEKSKMKEVTVESGGPFVRQNMGYYWVRFFSTRLPMLTRYLTVSSHFSRYVLRMHPKTINFSWRQMTNNIRRDYLNDQNDAMRFLDGAWESSTVKPEWLKQICFDAYRRSHAFIKQEKDGKLNIPIHFGTEDAISSLMQTPISFQCMLSSLYHITSHASLDNNIMILSCYLLHQMKWKAYCPMEVIALACRGEKLSRSQQHQYDNMMLELIPLITFKDEKELLNVTATGSNMALIHSGSFSNMDRETVSKWVSSIDDTEMHQETIMSYQRRVSDNCRKKRTNYVRPKLRFIQYDTPVWCDSSQKNPKFSEQGNTKMSSLSSILSEIFAFQQSEEASKIRMSKGDNFKEGHVPFKVWDSIADGTRLPKRKGVSQDKHFRDFETVCETGAYYSKTMSQLSDAKHFLEHFMIFCGMDPSVSRHDFFTKLIAPYIEKHNIVDRTVISNEYWIKPVVSDQTADSPNMFEWGCIPAVNKNGDTVVGVESILGMDIMWLVISQSLYCREWQSPSNLSSNSQISSDKSHSVIHLRNMSAASECIMSLLIHLSSELCCLPAMSSDSMGSKYIPLPFLSSNQLKNYRGNKILREPARIFFDKRLHLDYEKSCYEDFENMAGDESYEVACVLCKRARTDMTIIKLVDNEKIAFYRAILHEPHDPYIPTCRADLFIYPPESFFHMQTHLHLFSLALKAIYRKFSDDTTMPISESKHQITALAMSLYGYNLTADCVKHISNSMTEMMIDEEIPCVSWKYNFMFVMQKSRNGKIRVTPVSPTHDIVGTCEIFNQICKLYKLNSWGALPVDTEAIAFYPHEMSYFMSHGLSYEEDSHIKFKIDIQDFNIDTKKLPCYYFPVVLFPQLLWLQVKDRTVETDEGDEVVIVSARIEFDCSRIFMLSEEETLQWIDENQDIPRLEKNYELFIVKTSKVDVFFFWIRFVPPSVSNKKVLYYFFESRNCLKYSLVKFRNSSDTTKCVSYSIPSQFMSNSLICERKIPLCDSTYHPMIKNEGNVAVYFMSYDDGNYEERKNSLEIYSSRYEIAKMNLNSQQEKLKTQILEEHKVDITQNIKIKEDFMRARLSEYETALESMRKSTVTATVKHTMFINLDKFSENNWRADIPNASCMLECTIGQVKPHSNGKWLRCGNARATYLCPKSKEKDVFLDFVSMSVSLLPEGLSVWVIVDSHLKEIFEDYDLCFQNQFESDEKMKDESVDGDLLCEHHDDVVKAFYVLGSNITNSLHEQKAHFLFEFQNTYGDSQSITIEVPIFMQDDSDKYKTRLQRTFHDTRNKELLLVQAI